MNNTIIDLIAIFVFYASQSTALIEFIFTILNSLFVYVFCFAFLKILRES